MRASYIVSKGMFGVLDLFGPAVEFLTSPEEEGAVYCVMKGTIPPGVSIPLHSHADVESFFMLSGAVQVLSEQGDQFEWLNAKPGDFVQIPGGAKHGFRNTSNEAVVQLITTTPRLGRFFQEVGRPMAPGAPPGPPAPEDVRRFLETASRYGYWLATPEENAAAGIPFP